MMTLEEALNSYHNLTEAERDEFLRDILAVGGKIKRSTDPDKKTDIENEMPVCPRCSSTSVVKNGKDRNGDQRFMCRGCNRTFTFRTDTFLACSKRKTAVWSKYIQTMEEKMSIRESARACNISVVTSFVWRHKILDALSAKNEENARLAAEASRADDDDSGSVSGSDDHGDTETGDKPSVQAASAPCMSPNLVVVPLPAPEDDMDNLPMNDECLPVVSLP